MDLPLSHTNLVTGVTKAWIAAAEIKTFSTCFHPILTCRPMTIILFNTVPTALAFYHRGPTVILPCTIAKLIRITSQICFIALLTLTLQIKSMGRAENTCKRENRLTREFARFWQSEPMIIATQKAPKDNIINCTRLKV